MMPEFTARNVAKFIAKAIVLSKTSDIAEDVITDYTRFEEDDLVVDIGSKCIGWYVSNKLEPVTNKIVDTGADFITEQRTKYQAKKDAKKA
jgi:hypothetical protein